MIPGVAFGRLADAARHFGASRRRIWRKSATPWRQSFLILLVYRFICDVSMIAP